jgi:hypothetical protein
LTKQSKADIIKHGWIEIILEWFSTQQSTTMLALVEIAWKKAWHTHAMGSSATGLGQQWSIADCSTGGQIIQLW